jgi:DNA-directed RNA polymerase subunit F
MNSEEKIMKNNLEIFRRDYLNANSWAQRKEGVPLELLNKLSTEELKVAEKELINVLSLKDSWPVIGLGYIKSKDSLSKLYDLLPIATSNMKVIIAHSVFQISGDKEMLNTVLTEMKNVTNQYEIIDLLYMLPDFNDQKINEMLHGFYEHNEYLVAYNAARILGLSIDGVVNKFRDKER